MTVHHRRRIDPAALRAIPPQQRQIFESPALGWDTVAAGGVDVHTVPGSHQTIIEAPQVENLAEILETCIACAEQALAT